MLLKLKAVLLANADSAGYGTAYKHLPPEARDAMHASCEGMHPSSVLNEDGEIDQGRLAAWIPR